jgi:hypothetical protein
MAWRSDLILKGLCAQSDLVCMLRAQPGNVWSVTSRCFVNHLYLYHIL